MALVELNKNNDDEQIFGDFVASSLRNLHADSSKRKLRRKTQAIILEITDYDEALFESDDTNNHNAKANNLLLNDNGFANLFSPSTCSSTPQSVHLVDISNSRCTSAASYYENLTDLNLL